MTSVVHRPSVDHAGRNEESTEGTGYGNDSETKTSGDDENPGYGGRSSANSEENTGYGARSGGDDENTGYGARSGGDDENTGYGARSGVDEENTGYGNSGSGDAENTGYGGGCTARTCRLWRYLFPANHWLGIAVLMHATSSSALVFSAPCPCALYSPAQPCCARLYFPCPDSSKPAAE